MKYWDTSAIVPLLLRESTTEQVRAWFKEDMSVYTWWATYVECASAISRRGREVSGSELITRTAFAQLNELREHWTIVEPTEDVAETAVRLLRVQNLRAADALQLAAAVVASREKPASMTFVSFDDRLRSVAFQEGFDVLPAQN